MVRNAVSKGMWMGRATVVYAVVLALLVALLLVVAVSSGIKPVEAAFPGKNGKIAFTSDRDGNYEIYRMNQDGSSQQRLTNNPASDRKPSWQPLP